VVTLAAAQTLPVETTERALLIFVAFAVAVGSHKLQGITLPRLVPVLRFETAAEDTVDRAEQASLDEALRDAAVAAVTDSSLVRQDGSPFPADLIERVGARLFAPPDEETSASARNVLELRLALIGAMRRRLNALSSGGAFSTAALRRALAELDADELSLQLRLDDER
jgi:NhaP-type Na+/H+ or K+/H+ antiporter